MYEENFGGEANYNAGGRLNTRAIKRFSNAYMLVYIHKSHLSEILAEVIVEDIPNHLSKLILAPLISQGNSSKMSQMLKWLQPKKEMNRVSRLYSRYFYSIF